MANAPKLIFKVAPHILEDLGLNLYSDLPRVLVEYVANAYDADSPMANIAVDFARIDAERNTLRTAWQAAMTKWEADCNSWEEQNPDTRGQRPHQPQLDSQCLPNDITITIEDEGEGMARSDLQDKFLVAGRRR